MSGRAAYQPLADAPAPKGEGWGGAAERSDRLLAGLSLCPSELRGTFVMTENNGRCNENCHLREEDGAAEAPFIISMAAAVAASPQQSGDRFPLFL